MAYTKTPGKNIVENTCRLCGKVFKTKSHLLEKGRGVFCGKPCQVRYLQINRGPRSEETKEKLRAYRGENNHRYGKKLTAEHRENIRKSLVGILSGDRHPNWKGGITIPSVAARNGYDYKLWKRAVLARDGHRCIMCGGTEPRLHVHHNIHWSECPDVRYDVDNGATLCVDCHQAFHPNRTTGDYKRFFGTLYKGPAIWQMAGA
jgi:hypothetical protein